jgi:hypothetical protein
MKSVYLHLKAFQGIDSSISLKYDPAIFEKICQTLKKEARREK